MADVPETAGIGNPSAGQPGFVPPQAPDPGPVVAPAHGTAQPLSPSGWAAPSTQDRFAGGPPVPRRPVRARRGRTAAVAATLAGALLLVGLLSAVPMLPAPAPATQAATTPSASPALVTVTPSPAPGTATSLASGGDLGRVVPFRSTAGAGTVTVTGASWTDTGEIAPPAGRRYLVLSIEVACTSGSVAVDPILLVASTGNGQAAPGFGPALERPLGGRMLRAGETVSGQVGYALVPGAATLALLDESLRRLTTVGIPAP
jgi:hypothetical protein